MLQDDVSDHIDCLLTTRCHHALDAISIVAAGVDGRVSRDRCSSSARRIGRKRRRVRDVATQPIRHYRWRARCTALRFSQYLYLARHTCASTPLLFCSCRPVAMTAAAAAAAAAAVTAARAAAVAAALAAALHWHSGCCSVLPMWLLQRAAAVCC